MITANDLTGIMAIVPAMAREDGHRPDAEDAVDRIDPYWANTRRKHHDGNPT